LIQLDYHGFVYVAVNHFISAGFGETAGRVLFAVVGGMLG
jgi:hypothetical protein